MTARLERTGERMIVDQYGSSIEDYVIYLIHVAAYDFARRFTTGKRVLDYGCGTGYGPAAIAETAREVHAVDVSEEALAYARERHQRSNVFFQRIDPAGRLPFRDHSFDTVLSLQVFEHVRDVGQYLAQVRRVLVPGGHLILVTPDRSTRLLPFQRPWNRWHVREYSARALTAALAPYFGHVEIQHMSGRRDVIDVELRRCRKLSWLTLPATLPIVPDAVRVALLNALHAVRDRTPRRASAPAQFDFDASAIRIGPGLSPSLNLVAVASDPLGAGSEDPDEIG